MHKNHIMPDKTPRIKGKVVSKNTVKGSDGDNYKKRKEVTKVTKAGETVRVTTTKYSNKSEKANIKKLDESKASGQISDKLHKKLAVNTKKTVQVRGNETKGLSKPTATFTKLRK